MAVSGTTQCFKALYLQRMFSPSDAAILTFEQDFFVSVDPMAGGEKSDFAVVSFAVHRGVYQVRFIQVRLLLLPRVTLCRCRRLVNLNLGKIRGISMRTRGVFRIAFHSGSYVEGLGEEHEAV